MERYRQNYNRSSCGCMRSQNAKPQTPQAYRNNYSEHKIAGCGECTGLVMAFVKKQSWQNIYPPEKALEIGTVFAELDLPFTAKGGCRK